MSDFTPITTQEQFDSAIKERLERANKKYEGYTSPQDLEKLKADYDKQIADLSAAAEASAKKYANYDKELADRDSRIKSFETASIRTRVAHEMGLPYGAGDYLKGDDEKSIQESAKAVKALFGTGRKAAPTGSTEPSSRDSKTEALRSVLQNLKGQ